MTHEAPQEVNLGVEERRKYMFPGEIFVGNYKRGPIHRYSDLIFSTDMFAAQLEEWNNEKARLQTADWALYQFETSGLFRWVRYIPAISRLGELRPDRLGIVGMTRLTP